MGSEEQLLESWSGHVCGDQVILRIDSEKYDSSNAMHDRADLLAEVFDQDLAEIHHLDIGRRSVRFEMTQQGPTFIGPDDHRAEVHLFAVITPPHQHRIRYRDCSCHG